MISYNKLWKLLIDKNLNKKELIKLSGVSSSSIAKMTKGQNVTTDVLCKICSAPTSMATMLGTANCLRSLPTGAVPSGFCIVFCEFFEISTDLLYVIFSFAFFLFVFFYYF